MPNISLTAVEGDLGDLLSNVTYTLVPGQPISPANSGGTLQAMTFSLAGFVPGSTVNVELQLPGSLVGSSSEIPLTYDPGSAMWSGSDGNGNFFDPSSSVQIPIPGDGILTIILGFSSIAVPQSAQPDTYSANVVCTVSLVSANIAAKTLARRNSPKSRVKAKPQAHKEHE